MTGFWLGLVAGAAAIAATGSAAAQNPAASAWRQLVEADVEAAHALLREDHPGALEETGDAAFRARLARAHAEARERAAQVSSYPGYAATMLGFANAMGDKHIWSRPMLVAPTIDWAGMLIARRGDHWVVADEEEGSSPSLVGARVVACDGNDIDMIAERRLGGFRAVWSIEAQRVASAPWLLLDDGNPFAPRPGRCSFEGKDGRQDVTLRWRPIRRTDLAPRVALVVRTGEPGFGVRRSGSGYWIALQSLSDRAIPIVEAVREQAQEMRRAPFVVLDMRGNGGGNSVYGDQILEALVGPAAARGSGDGESESCNPVWRTSERNLRVLEEISRGAAERMGPQAAAFWESQYRRATGARAAGRALSAPPSCRSGNADEVPRGPAPAAEYTGTLFVLTDHRCFSSCLLVTDRWRRFGAIHVGEATDAATHYFEVREDMLPSGLMRFSTLQALSPASPPQIGPFVPDRSYAGDIADTPDLEQWVASLVEQKSGS